MGNHYIRRFDLSKYTLKSFDDSNEIACDKNNNDILTYDANGTQRVVLDNVGNIVTAGSQFILNGTAQGAAGSSTTIEKTVTAIADNTATTVFTISVPNAEVAACVQVSLLGVSGAGGAIGEGESSNTGYGQVVITRTSGVASVGVAATLTTTAVATVAGGNALATLAYSIVNGGEGVTLTNTVKIQVTIHASAGSATNHICVAEAVLQNFKASGATIA